jgi:hypothetical protein
LILLSPSSAIRILIFLFPSNLSKCHCSGHCYSACIINVVVFRWYGFSIAHFFSPRQRDRSQKTRVYRSVCSRNLNSSCVMNKNIFYLFD